MKTYYVHLQTRKFPLAIITSIALFIILFAGGISLLLTVQNNSLLFKIMLWFYGWMLWTLAEYIIHRFIEHDVFSSISLKGYHNHHHRNPDKLKVTGKHRFFMLITVILLCCLALYTKNYIAFTTGFYSGFTFFCLMHYFLHKPAAASIFPTLFMMHIYHHTKYPNQCFGVTTYFWDYVFNSLPSFKENISATKRRFYFNGKKL